jgi:hypothetical protein
VFGPGEVIDAMTAQIPDAATYDGPDYVIAGIRGGALFNPREHGLRPRQVSTACWRGYQCQYGIEADQLWLEVACISAPGWDLHCADFTHAPELFGVRAKPGGPIFQLQFEGLHRPIEFSGRLLLARGFIRELYVHMGFHPAWKYRNVVECSFQGGMLSEVCDRSEAMATIRSCKDENDLEPGPSGTTEEILKWILDSFDLGYDY